MSEEMTVIQEIAVLQAQANVGFGRLSSSARDVLGQLFVQGPAWDGGVVSKVGRDALVDAGLVYRTRHGWQALTQAGLDMACLVDVKNRRDTRWYRKQQCL